MFNKVTNDSRVYTDIQGLAHLHHEAKTDPEAAKKEVAKQFESILVQMMLRSMRDANKSFASDLFGGDQMEFYQDIFDKQLSLIMSNTGLGFAESIERNIDQNYSHTLNNYSKESHSYTLPTEPISRQTVEPSYNDLEEERPWKKAKENECKIQTLDTPEEFVKQLWPAAKQAANLIGTHPGIILAQAALETNWGKKVLPYGDNASSFNLFNIKADNNWDKKTTLMDSLEQKNGVLVKERSSFRSYDSFKDSLMDYANFLKQNTRYNEALKKAPDPRQFVQELQNAGFATDSKYADKILKIFSSRTFQNLLGKMQ